VNTFSGALVLSIKLPPILFFSFSVFITLKGL
jgi:hypothetical protein